MHYYFHLVLFHISSNCLWKLLIGHFILFVEIMQHIYFKLFVGCIHYLSSLALFHSLQKSYVFLICPVEYIANKLLRSTLRCKEMLCFLWESFYFPVRSLGILSVLFSNNRISVITKRDLCHVPLTFIIKFF